MIRDASASDLPEIYVVINDAASAYKGIIPADRWVEPYMSEAELTEQIADGVRFRCWVEDEGVDAGRVTGVMGIQDKGEVNLIRHAYVRSAQRGQGIGGQLLADLTSQTSKPILIGTWQAATWAIRFYQRHGFALVSESRKNALLRTFWNIPDRQVETSVVLASQDFEPEQAG
ncbi:N-acetyltransferase [Deinococcus psychrotolerans]|uniref:N-acetyltransferase n=1 Tax=Deinococcus psychrotolerans TaxID=2489213 RepID=A0A3G8YJH0_9DEIO|nr:GNAT family N-acetyltransferase [Deinococcus psychrotolerans]AZI41591.1 N-acetyltransferase [Deinococcus psychrotolerans]